MFKKKFKNFALYKESEYFFKIMLYCSFFGHALFIVSDYFQGVLTPSVVGLRIVCGVVLVFLTYYFKKHKSIFFIFIILTLQTNYLFMIYLSQLSFYNITGISVVAFVYLTLPMTWTQYFFTLALTIFYQLLNIYFLHENNKPIHLPLHIISINMCLLTIFIQNFLTMRRNQLKISIEEKSLLLDQSNLIQSTLKKTHKQLIHDVKSPLMALKHLADKETKDQNTNLLKFATDRIEGIIQELEKSKTQNEPINAVSTIKHLINEKKFTHANTIIKLKAHNIKPDLKINLKRINKQLFSRIISNLINNAVEAQPENICNVEIKLNLSEDHLKIEIKDNGPGIKPINFEKVVKQGYSTKESGQGLGLSHAHEVVSEAGGSLNLINNNGLLVEIKLKRKKN